MSNGETQNYTLGRGELFFSRFKPGTRIPEGFKYIGNTPEFNLTIEQELLEHFSSDRGIREKDDSVPLQVNRTGSFTTDNIDLANVAYFFFGVNDTVVEAGTTVTDEAHVDVKQGHYIQLGISDTRPAGVRGIAYPSGSEGDFIVSNAESGGTPYVDETDYTVDPVSGMLYIVPGGGIAEGADIFVTYTIRASEREQVVSGSAPVEGALRYVENNPKGKNKVWAMGQVQVSPNGDLALKGDEWQTIPFTLEVLKPSNAEAIYCDGVPTYS